MQLQLTAALLCVRIYKSRYLPLVTAEPTLLACLTLRKSDMLTFPQANQFI
jgi:hypothetical protein